MIYNYEKVNEDVQKKFDEVLESKKIKKQVISHLF
jgi:hypothetical protein